MADEPIPYYPFLPCWRAPLPPNIAPFRNCRCRVCTWALARRVDIPEGPVIPGTPAWDALLALAGATAALPREAAA